MPYIKDNTVVLKAELDGKYMKPLGCSKIDKVYGEACPPIIIYVYIYTFIGHPANPETEGRPPRSVRLICYNIL